MSFRLQHAYGHGGTRLKHILICAVHELRPPVPLWQYLLLALVLLAIPLLIGRFEMPAPPVTRQTIIDISKLDVQAPPVQPRRAAAQRLAMKPTPVEPVFGPGAPPDELPAGKGVTRGAARAPQRSEVPAPAEAVRPAIARPSGYESAPAIDVYPHLARERKPVEATGVPGTPATRLRRAPVPADAWSGAGTAPDAAAVRVRGGGGWAHALQLPTAADRVAIPRRTRQGAEAIASSQAARPAPARSAPLPSLEEGGGPPPALRERSKNPGAGGRTPSGIALSRGVSLMSLKICDSSLQQEEAVKSVLSVVGSRLSCRNEKGEFQFKGTKRVSSFNLMIFPAGGREPSHRCEELEYAYQCLKKN